MATATARIEVLVDGTGPALVMIPSSQRDSLHEGELAQSIAAHGYTVLRPQPRGMGRSVGPLDDITLCDLADDVAGVIDALGDGPAVVLGHAFGHAVARVADLRHPAKVRGVVQLGASCREPARWLFDTLDIAADMDRPRQERLLALRKVLFAPGNDPTPWLDGWHPHLRPAYRRAGSTPPKSAWWPVSDSPILDLQGACDPWRPAHTRNELREVLGRQVEVRVIEGASHALVPERPGEIAREVLDWVGNL